MIFLLGYHENKPEEKFAMPDSQVINKESVLPILQRFLQPQSVDTAFAQLKTEWDRLLSKFQVNTPDAHTNRMVNIWNAYQCMVTFNMSRSASYFESGIGRGMGFRDSNQDLLGFVHLVPERSRERILELAATQLQNGGAFHQYQPLTKRGNNDIGSGFNDDPLWLVLGASAYVKETGDTSILDEMVPYENQPGTEMPLYEHLTRHAVHLERAWPAWTALNWPRRLERLPQPNCFSDTCRVSLSKQPLTRKGKSLEERVIAGLLCACRSGYGRALGRTVQRGGKCRFFQQPADFYARKAAQMEAAVWVPAWTAPGSGARMMLLANRLAQHLIQKGKFLLSRKECA